MSIETVSHLEVKPQSLKLPPKWKDKLDANHVRHLAIQIASGQSLPVTVNVENWVLKGRHTSAAYLLVQKGDPDLGIAPHPKIKVPITKVTGTPQDEKILELSSIVNQRKAGPEEEAVALKEMVELLEQQGRQQGKKVKHEEVVEQVAKATGKSPRTVAKKLREAKAPEERKPSKPRGKKIKVQDENGKDLLPEPTELAPNAPEPPDTQVEALTVAAGDNPVQHAVECLEACLSYLGRLRECQGVAMNALFAQTDYDMSAACDQLQKDIVTLDEIELDYRRYVHELSERTGNA